MQSFLRKQSCALKSQNYCRLSRHIAYRTGQLRKKRRSTACTYHHKDIAWGPSAVVYWITIWLIASTVSTKSRMDDIIRFRVVDGVDVGPTHYEHALCQHFNRPVLHHHTTQTLSYTLFLTLSHLLNGGSSKPWILCVPHLLALISHVSGFLDWARHCFPNHSIPVQLIRSHVLRSSPVETSFYLSKSVQ